MWVQCGSMYTPGWQTSVFGFCKSAGQSEKNRYAYARQWGGGVYMYPHWTHIGMSVMRATPGRCTCASQILRAEAENGQVVTVDIWTADAAAELRAWAADRPTYQLAWRNGLDITLRSRRDIKLKPVGYRAGDSIVLEHRCPDPQEAP